jgi:hypothetical protein
VGGKEKRSGQKNCRSDFRKSIFDLRLANLGAQEAAIALQANFATGQQIGHRRDRFFCAASAGTNGENQITKGKFRAGLQDQGVLLHWICLFDSI